MEIPRFHPVYVSATQETSLCHAPPARDTRLPSDSGWSASHFVAFRSPSLRSIRAAPDGSALPSVTGRPRPARRGRLGSGTAAAVAQSPSTKQAPLCAPPCGFFSVNAILTGAVYHPLGEMSRERAKWYDFLSFSPLTFPPAATKMVSYPLSANILREESAPCSSI